MKRMLILTSLSSVILLSACTSSTKQAVNKVESNQPQISQTIQQEQEKQLKRKVAIARFSDETKNSSSIFVDKNYDQIGKQASDILSSRLTESGKFLLLERDDLDKINTEQTLSGKSSSVVGADYLIVGSVSEFGRKTVSETGIFSRNKIQIASATVNIRLINTTTSEVIFSQEASGEARTEANTVLGVGERAAFDSTLNDKAISAAISKLISNLMENLLDAPWKAYLVGEQDGFYIMTGGASQGIEAGDEFAVFAKGKIIKNPQTGLNIELPGKHLTKATVVQTMGTGSNEISLVSLDKPIGEISLEDLVVKESK
ncbi:CsgG/HfaB family protein [Aliiglaciecola litoralis]|uniref:Curli production assembly/transport component CsgG n=1 Tax=Aliiglaciecola litoralis TaxID=582857 RepID=A0ABN1LT22_9ALTE